MNTEWIIIYDSYRIYKVKLTKVIGYFYVIPTSRVLLLEIWVSGKSLAVLNMQENIVRPKIQRLVKNLKRWYSGFCLDLIWYLTLLRSWIWRRYFILELPYLRLRIHFGYESNEFGRGTVFTTVPAIIAW